MFKLKLLQLFSIISSYFFDESHVQKLTRESFDGVINSNKFVVVKFYKSNSRACRAIASEYENVAVKLKELKLKILLTEIDGEEEPDLVNRFKITGYPTLLLFKQGQPDNLGQVEKAEDIQHQINRRTGHSVTQIESETEFKALLEKEEIVVVIFANDKVGLEWQIFYEVATQIDIPFVTSNVNTIQERFALSHSRQIFVYRKVDNFFDDYHGKLTVNDLSEWINWNLYPSFIEYSIENATFIFNKRGKKQLIFFTKLSDENFEENARLLREVFGTGKTRMQVVVIDVEKETSKYFMDRFHVTDAETPIYTILQPAENVKLVMPKNKPTLELEELKRFTNNVFENHLEEYLNSEEIPDDWNDHPVKVLVGKNFKEVIQNKSKHHLVFFYANWCDHCELLHSIWEELAEAFRDTDVMVAKINAAVNDIDDVNIEGFPTIYFFSKGGENRIQFISQKRKFREIEAFVVENAGLSKKDEL